MRHLGSSPAGLLDRLGTPGRVLSNQLTVAAALRPRHAWRHFDDLRHARTWGPAARRALYAHIWADAATIVGATLEPLVGDFVRIRLNTSSTLVWFHEVQLGDPVTLRLALDKQAQLRLLMDAGVPTAVSLEFDRADGASAVDFLRAHGGPHVVKPARGTSSGEGVTADIRTPAELRRAQRWAHRWSEQLLIERQVEGDEYRLLFLDSELLGAVRRSPPSLLGDGQSTVEELISKLNRHRAERAGWAGLTFVKVDLDMLIALRRKGLALSSVPDRGVPVRLKSTPGANGALDNETMAPDALSPDLVAEAAIAVAATGLRLAGVDVITPRPDRSLIDAGGAVIEVNATPGLHYHYLVADAAGAVPVARPVLAALLDG